MLTPEQFQEQILPYLYDLLDRQERLRFEAYVEEHPEAKADVDAGRARQALLAQAVREDFAAVTFVPPPATAKASRAVTDPALRFQRPVEPRSRRAMVRWAVAACVTLVVFGGAGYFGIHGWTNQKQQFAQANDNLQNANLVLADLQKKVQTEQDRARDDIRLIEDQINKLVENWNRDAKSSRRVLEDKQVQVIISGPKNIQAGAKNEYKIEVKSRGVGAEKQKPAMMAQIVNPATREVLFKEKVECDYGGSVHVELPRDLQIKPGAALALELTGKSDNGVPFEVREHLKLVAPEYVTHLVTDRPMYRPGEVVRFRSLTLDRFSLRPPTEDLKVRFTITGPKGDELFSARGLAQVIDGPGKDAVKGPDGLPLRGIGAAEYTLADDLAGGQYTLTVSEAHDRFPPEKCPFLVNRWQTPLFNKELTFHRSTYAAGDRVEFNGTAKRIDGNQAQLGMDCRVSVDGHELTAFPLMTNLEGRFRGNFQIPANMKARDGVVALVIRDGTNTETLLRPIPLVQNELLVDFYPEGGDLVAGVASRVYFQVRTPTRKPADLKGQIVDAAGAVVADIQTVTDDKEPGLNQGMGLFELTPLPSQKYRLKLDSPSGIRGNFFLPAVKSEGVVLRLPKGIVDNTIDVAVANAGKDRELLVGAYCRGRLLDFTQTKIAAGKSADLTLRPALGVGGVYRITVFEKLAGGQYQPLAERLIFRRSPEKLALAVSGMKPSYQPGERVQLSLHAANETKERVPAVLLVSVVDLSVGKLANDKTARAMPTHFLLTSEVRRAEDLENADFFLGNHPRAELGLDLLLGVQGWRRFAEQDPGRFAALHKEEPARFLPALAPGGMQAHDPAMEVIAAVDNKYAPRFVELQEKLSASEKVEIGLPEKHAEVQQKVGAVMVAQTQRTQSEQALRDYEGRLVRATMAVAIATALFAGLLLLYLGMKRLSAGKSAIPYFATGGFVLAFLFLGSLVGTLLLMGGRGGIVGRWDEGDFKGGPMLRNPGMAAPPMAAEMAKPDMKMAEAIPADMPAPPQAVPPRAVKGLPPKEGPAPANLVMAIPRAGQVAADAMMPAIAPMPGALGGRGAGRGLGPNFEKKLRHDGNYQDIVKRRLGRAVPLPESISPFTIREYSHVHKPEADLARIDFTETVYWHPAIVLSDGNGRIEFDLSDSTTQYQVMAVGHTADGRLGAVSFDIAAKLPYSVEPRVPIEITSSDKVVLPVAVTNNTEKETTAHLVLQTTGLVQLDGTQGPLVVEPRSKSRRLYTLSAQPAQVPGGPVLDAEAAGREAQATVYIQGKFSPAGFDSVKRSFKIVPDGFPIAQAHSGLLEGNVQHEFILPDTWVPGSMQCQVQVFPSTLAELQKGLESLLREPCGCFEQSSTSNYPNVLILNYLKESNQTNTDVEKRARQLLDSGYQKLTSFECMDPREQVKRQGYEWFGQTAPPHEALTAYGLLQFKDMARVFPVDKAMLERTQKYLLDARDGNGGFRRNPRALDSFGRAPDHVTNAYIVWALTESGIQEKLDIELKALYGKAKDSKDPYFVALVGLAHLNRSQTEEGLELLKNLRSAQKNEGQLAGAVTSITGSGGRDLDIEATALAVLGWLRANRPADFHQNIDKAVKWIGKQRGDSGGFGSTQSTILALKAVISFTQENKKAMQPGELRLIVNDQQLAALSFPGAISESLTLKLPPEYAPRLGMNRIRAELTGKNVFPYTMTVAYRTMKPANPDNCPVHLETSFNRTELTEGDSVRLKASVVNRTGKGQGMTVAIIGLPGGLSLPEDMAQLKELSALRHENGKERPGIISAWELKGRELILYWRDLAPEARIDVSLDLVARIPGTYRGPASRAYLYYNADKKFWVEPLGVNINPGE